MHFIEHLQRIKNQSPTSVETDQCVLCVTIGCQTELDQKGMEVETQLEARAGLENERKREVIGRDAGAAHAGEERDGQGGRGGGMVPD
uniref:Uncharacterized protein n=1 Tax=Rhizophora mucronata TaxID=61149 RepID=A0A2P2PKH8_RHIMU